MWSVSVEVCVCGVALAWLLTRLLWRDDKRVSRPAHVPDTLRVLVVNEHSALGREVCARLRAAGCVVNSEEVVDALVVAGMTREGPGLLALADLVTADLDHTVKEVEQSARRVKAGGRIVWAAASAGTGRDSFSGAADAFDTVMRLQLLHIAHRSRCEAVWLGRRCEAGRAVHSALLSPSWNSVRGVCGAVYGWLNMST